MAFANPPNFLPQPKIRSDNGMLVTQAYSIGHFNIEEDQALVMTLEAGNAGYATVPVTNLWGITTDHVRRTLSLNTSQSAPNADGTFTCVLSIKTPVSPTGSIRTDFARGFIFAMGGVGAAKQDSRHYHQ